MRRHSRLALGIFFFIGLLLLGFFSSLGIGASSFPERLAYFVVQYNEHDSASAQQRIQEHFAGRIEGYIPEHQYIVQANEEELLTLQDEGIITSFVLYYDLFDVTLPLSSSTDTYLVALFSSADRSDILERLSQQDISFVALSPTFIQVEASSFDFFGRLSSLEGISSIMPLPLMETANNQSNLISGTPLIQQRFQLYGKNQIIGISDSGLDTGNNDSSMHDDLEGRILELVNKAPTRLTKPWDQNGHGTHVAGSVLGNGNLSGSNSGQHQYLSSYAGSAPEASLIFQAVGDDQGTNFIYPPYPISMNLFLPTYQQGGRFHSNSWGSIGSVFYGMYENTAQDIDQFTNQYQEFLVLFAAGNNGYSGRVTVIPPSTNKNGLSVGAADTQTPGQRAGFSSQGPTLDGRYKPDVLAPGTNIVSTKSSLGRSCYSLPSNPQYCTFSGTSMATPHLAGLAALIREYYQTFKQHPNPSAALIKATVFAGTDTMGKTIPDPEVGWGRVNMTRSLPSDGTYLAYFDITQGLLTGKQHNYTISVHQGKPLTVMLVWTDVAANVLPLNGTKLVNDLDLIITAPNGTVYVGNDVQPPYSDKFDRINNVERVSLSTPASGKYTISIRGFNVPLGTQNYAGVALYDNAFIKVIPLNLTVAPCVIGGQPC
ncbi:MAG: S8 family serine peptidase [Nanoarchaeota archaeon]